MDFIALKKRKSNIIFCGGKKQYLSIHKATCVACLMFSTFLWQFHENIQIKIIKNYLEREGHSECKYIYKKNVRTYMREKHTDSRKNHKSTSQFLRASSRISLT